MQPLDWIFTGLPLLIVIVTGLMARRYMRSVADFLSGGRVAGRYLLAVAGGELQAGAAVFVAYFEQLSQGGFAFGFWGALGGPIYLVIAICGFVAYRRRETRAMTLAQFFEIRYNKAFRLCTGVLGFLAGILNFGIIPSVGARFLVYFWQLPPTVPFLSIDVPTYIPLMFLFLSVTLFVTLSGGVITLLVVNCIEGIMSQIFYLIIIAALLTMFNWSQVYDVLGHQPVGHSKLNPFDSSSVKDFNIWFVLMTLFLTIYGTGAWQNAGAYAGAALNPHESVMGSVLGRWREMGKTAVITVMGICAIVFMNHPAFAQQTVPVKEVIDRIADAHSRDQMGVPIALSYLLPVGIKGLFCAILLMGIFGGDATHLHSWGSIFVQDILVPLRKKPFGPKQHIWMLRLSVIGVAIFAFLFGCVFRTTEYILMWWQITTTVYVGGAGAAIIGGLYWKKGTTQAAFAALATGSILSTGGIILKQLAGRHVGSALQQMYVDHIGAVPSPLVSMGSVGMDFYNTIITINGSIISFFSALIAIAVYVIVSLLTCREDFNMERMLHRGKYASLAPEGAAPAPAKPKFTWGKVIGIDENFTKADKWVAVGLFSWGMMMLGLFLVVTAWNLIAPWSEESWSHYWNVVGVGIPIFLCVVTGVWFTWGGITDIRKFFRHLAQEKVNHLDDGTVVNNQNLDEVMKSDSKSREH